MPRQAQDFYPTPYWCVDSLMRAGPFITPGSRCLEPCAGQFNIIDAVNLYVPQIKWTTCDINEDPRLDFKCNFLDIPFVGRPFDTIITNPPYSLAMEFILKSLSISHNVIMLLRLNFLGSSKRYSFMSRNTPDVYVLTPRPSFVGTGTDATEYGWFVWNSLHPKTNGKLYVLERHSGPSPIDCLTHRPIGTTQLSQTDQ